ncbi:MAG: hemin uptake protein HemP [Gammaproteobacteria bacterium]|jgi:hemin uptake protein HemP|nr:hemin uptake protein HemP [Gammaproteobacteria bacterium]
MPAGNPHIQFQLVRRSPVDVARAGASPAGCDCEVDSACLLQGRREVLIRHAGECYRLRHTRNGKLILTK